VITPSDATLAQFALAAYSSAPPLPAGFAAAPLAPAPVAGATYDAGTGLFLSGNAAALAATGLLDGRQTLVLAFRGSDDREDSLNDLRNINADYADLQPLVAAADAYAASGAVEQVVVAGHSLGGALTQVFMAEHPDVPGGVTYRGQTFGSPGALLPPAADARIENVVVADDPVPALGAHRGEIGALLRADPALAAVPARRAAEEFPGLTEQDALDSLPFLTANHVNRGTLVLLPAEDGRLDLASPSGLLEVDLSRHAPTLYAEATAAAAAGTLAQRQVPVAPAGAEDAAYRAVYAGDYPGGLDVSGLVEDVAEAWARRDGLLDDAQAWLDRAGGGGPIAADWGGALDWARGELDLF
jgi:pimeloyl-ACP methyl ester carboxylesterase